MGIDMAYLWYMKKALNFSLCSDMKVHAMYIWHYSSNCYNPKTWKYDILKHDQNAMRMVHFVGPHELKETITKDIS